MTALTLRQVETFRTVMKAGGMTRAAAVLAMSQPSVSRIIADLEEIVGTRLFDRAGRRLVPSAAGCALFDEVEHSFQGLTHIEAVARSIGQGRSERLRLVIAPSLVALVTETLLARFAAGNPRVMLTMEVETTRRAFERRVIGDCDIGITFEPLAIHALTVVPIGRIEAVCVTPRGTRAVPASRVIAPADLDGVRMVGYRPDGIFRQRVDRLLGQAGAIPIYVAEARTTAAVCQLAASLGAVAIIPSPSLDPIAGSLLSVRPFKPAIESEVLMVRPAHRPPTPVAMRFLAQVEHLRATGAWRLSPAAMTRRKGAA